MRGKEERKKRTSEGSREGCMREERLHCRRFGSRREEE